MVVLAERIYERVRRAYGKPHKAGGDPVYRTCDDMRGAFNCYVCVADPEEG